VITGLIAAFTANVAGNPKISDEVQAQVEVRASAGASFVASDEVRAAAQREGLDPATTDALVADYEDAQLQALKVAFLAAASLIVASLFFTRNLPTKRFDELQADTGPPVAVAGTA
jgi:hypothetical protein